MWIWIIGIIHEKRLNRNETFLKVLGGKHLVYCSDFVNQFDSVPDTCSLLNLQYEIVCPQNSWQLLSTWTQNTSGCSLTSRSLMLLQPVATTSSSKALSACVPVLLHGAHCEHKLWRFWTDLLWQLIIVLNEPYFSLLCTNSVDR